MDELLLSLGSEGSDRRSLLRTSLGKDAHRIQAVGAVVGIESQLMEFGEDCYRSKLRRHGRKEKILSTNDGEIVNSAVDSR